MRASGRLHQFFHSAYAVGHRHLTRHGHYMAAVLAAHPKAVISHKSAGWLWGLLSNPPTEIHVTAPTRRHRKASFRLHFAPLVDEDVAACEGLPVTAVSRTLLDLAAELSFGRLERAVEQADRLELLDLRPIDSLLTRVSGHRGVRRLRHALGIYRPDGRFTRSKLERRFLDLLREAGLPLPLTNCFIEGYELDAYWPEERFAVELDTYDFHGSRAAFERDPIRHEELKLAGIEMIRVTGHRLDRNPGEVARSIAELLNQRRLQLS
jgi:very-short-patch-repair endonuclease